MSKTISRYQEIKREREKEMGCFEGFLSSLRQAWHSYMHIDRVICRRTLKLDDSNLIYCNSRVVQEAGTEIEEKEKRE